MNDFTKKAYEAGAAQALQDFGITKTAEMTREELLKALAIGGGGALAGAGTGYGATVAQMLEGMGMGNYYDDLGNEKPPTRFDRVFRHKYMPLAAALSAGGGTAYGLSRLLNED